MFKTMSMACLLSLVLGAGLCSAEEADPAAEPAAAPVEDDSAKDDQRPQGRVDNANRQLRDLKQGMQKKMDRRPGQIDEQIDTQR